MLCAVIAVKFGGVVPVWPFVLFAGLVFAALVYRFTSDNGVPRFQLVCRAVLDVLPQLTRGSGCCCFAAVLAVGVWVRRDVGLPARQ